METVNVALGARAYSIHIGCGLLDRGELLLPVLKQRRVAIVSNGTVAPLYLERLKNSLQRCAVESVNVVLPDGEQYKDWRNLNAIFDLLISTGCERGTPLIALGGGVVGDMTGFAAACYQRGAPFIQIPTTLLAQVDSSIGGKTAINHPLGKNMIGAFSQPRLVLIDSTLLDTLPEREYRSGLAEILKIGLIRDCAFFDWLEVNLDAILDREPDAVITAIRRSCENKAAVVVADEMENGERALLNLGHTFGHAIETGLGYGAWLHGEAVAAGILMAAELSHRLGWIDNAALVRIERTFRRAGLPVFGPAIPVERYMALMRHDKKVINGELRLILLEAIGRAVISTAASDDAIAQAIIARTGKP